MTPETPRRNARLRRAPPPRTPAAHATVDDLPHWARDAQPPEHLWRAAVERLAQRAAADVRDAHDEHDAHLRRVAVKEAVLKELKSASPPNADTVAEVERELDEAYKDMHLPLRSGWLLRMLHNGNVLGLKDFYVESLSASLSIALEPGAEPSVRVGFGASEDGDQTLVVRCEHVKLLLNLASHFLPGLKLDLEALTLALKVQGSFCFSFESGRWVGKERHVDVLSLKQTNVGGGSVYGRTLEMVSYWLMQKFCPGVLQRRLMRMLPPELGSYLQSASRPSLLRFGVRLEGTPLSQLVAPLASGPTFTRHDAFDAHASSRAQAHAIGLSVRELHLATRALYALVHGDEEGVAVSSKRRGGSSAEAGIHSAVTSEGHASLLSLLRWKTEVGRQEDEFYTLCLAWRQKASRLHGAECTPCRHTLSAAAASVLQSAEDEKRKGEREAKAAFSHEAEGVVTRLLDGLAKLERKPMRIELDIHHVDLSLRLDAVFAALALRQERLQREAEAEVVAPPPPANAAAGDGSHPGARASLSGRLSALLSFLEQRITRIKCDVSSELKMADDVFWLQFSNVDFRGPVVANARPNPSEALLGSMLFRRWALHKNQDIAMDFMTPLELNGPPPSAMRRIIDAAREVGMRPHLLEALGAEREYEDKERARDSAPQASASEEGEEGDWGTELRKLAQGRVRGWDCGVVLDVDKLREAIESGQIAGELPIVDVLAQDFAQPGSTAATGLGTSGMATAAAAMMAAGAAVNAGDRVDKRRTAFARRRHRGLRLLRDNRARSEELGPRTLLAGWAKVRQDGRWRRRFLTIASGILQEPSLCVSRHSSGHPVEKRFSLLGAWMRAPTLEEGPKRGYALAVEFPTGRRTSRVVETLDIETEQPPTSEVLVVAFGSADELTPWETTLRGEGVEETGGMSNVTSEASASRGGPFGPPRARRRSNSVDHSTLRDVGPLQREVSAPLPAMTAASSEEPDIAPQPILAAASSSEEDDGDPDDRGSSFSRIEPEQSVRLVRRGAPTPRASYTAGMGATPRKSRRWFGWRPRSKSTFEMGLEERHGTVEEASAEVLAAPESLDDGVGVDRGDARSRAVRHIARGPHDFTRFRFEADEINFQTRLPKLVSFGQQYVPQRHRPQHTNDTGPNTRTIPTLHRTKCSQLTTHNTAGCGGARTRRNTTHLTCTRHSSYSTTRWR